MAGIAHHDDWYKWLNKLDSTEPSEWVMERAEGLSTLHEF